MCDKINNQPSATTMALAAAGGGFVQAAVGNPLQVWKNQRQLGRLEGRWQDQWRQVPALTGMPLFCASTVVSNMWCYTAQQVLRGPQEKRGVQPHTAGMVSGVAAGVSEALLTNPWRRVLVMQQAPEGARLGAAAAVRQVLQREGWTGLYAGVGLSAVRNGVGCGVFFPLAAALRGEPEQQCPSRDLASAVAASATSTALVHPVDTVISCIQGSPARATAQAVIYRIIARHGMRGLGRGLTPTLIAVVPGSAVAYATTMALVGALPSAASNPDAAPPASGLPTT